jgi:hypothetical protein
MSETADLIEAMKRTPAGRAHLENVHRAIQDAVAHKFKKGRQNEGFTQVSDSGWKAFRALIGANGTAAALYAFLAEKCDSQGAVVAPQQVLMDELGIARNTLWRACKELEKRNLLVRIEVAGNVYAYCLDPYKVWKSYASSKNYAAFITRTLVSNPAQTEKRITMLMKKQAMAEQAAEEADEEDDGSQPDLPFQM